MELASGDEALASEGKSGHWGLIGMRERAHKIGAMLSLDTGTSGTPNRTPGDFDDD